MMFWFFFSIDRFLSKMVSTVQYLPPKIGSNGFFHDGLSYFYRTLLSHDFISRLNRASAATSRPTTLRPVLFGVFSEKKSNRMLEKNSSGMVAMTGI